LMGGGEGRGGGGAGGPAGVEKKKRAGCGFGYGGVARGSGGGGGGETVFPGAASGRMDIREHRYLYLLLNHHSKSMRLVRMLGTPLWEEESDLALLHFSDRDRVNRPFLQ